MTNNGTLNYNLTSEKPAYMLSEENYTKYINERNKFDPTYPDPNDIRFDAPQYSYSVEETSLYKESSSGELTLVGSVYYPKTGNLVKFENNQAIELDEPVTGNKVPLNSIKKLIPGIEYEFVPIPDYSKEYLTFVALEDGTFQLNRNAVSYSLDNGKTWTELAANTASPTVTVGNKIMWKATLTPTNSGIGKFISTGNFDVQGNPMSLLYGDNFKDQTNLTGKNYAFYQLFYQNANVVNAKNLSLPVTTLVNGCYDGMFYLCTNLITAPELPATTLAYNCYHEMFLACTSLTTAPELPATTLALSCYNSMFWSCRALTTAPELPATTLADRCYYSMFRSCTSLTAAPELPATTLTDSCYSNMFNDCPNLITAPELPATTLVSECYNCMFEGCTNLTTPPELPATTLASYCYHRMFYLCTNLTTAPELPATTLVSSCYELMFNGCTNLNYIKAMFTTTPSTNYTRSWVYDVSSTGTFVKNSAAEWDVTGNEGIPTGWTVETASE